MTKNSYDFSHRQQSNIADVSVRTSRSSSRRDSSAILTKMRAQAAQSGLVRLPHVEAVGEASEASAAIGLTLGQLEDRRWGVSPSLARFFLEQRGLPYEGRRARLIYSWSTILKVEGVPDELAIHPKHVAATGLDDAKKYLTFKHDIGASMHLGPRE